METTTYVLVSVIFTILMSYSGLSCRSQRAVVFSSQSIIDDELAWKRIAKLLPKIGNATAHKIWNILSSSNRPLKSMKKHSLAHGFLGVLASRCFGFDFCNIF